MNRDSHDHPDHKLMTELDNACIELQREVELNAALEAKVAELTKSNEALKTLRNIADRDIERLSDKFQKSEQLRLLLEDALNKIRELSQF